MEPTNQKHLYHLLMDAMAKLEKGEMTVPAAREMSNLGARVNTAVKIEQERARLRMELEQHAQNGGSAIKIREIEGKNFD
jgi:hypothetical protein